MNLPRTEPMVQLAVGADKTVARRVDKKTLARSDSFMTLPDTFERNEPGEDRTTAGDTTRRGRVYIGINNLFG